MKKLSLAAGMGIVILANAVALIHAARNRSGIPSAEITLTNRELSYSMRSANDEDSGVTLYLQWTTPNSYLSSMAAGYVPPNWLNRQKLQQLGFDCRVEPGADGAARFYERQKPRRVFVAVEYDGPAWRALVDAFNAGSEQRAREGRKTFQNLLDASRLIPIDADLNADALRARYPNRSNVLIVPGVAAIFLNPASYPWKKPDPKTPVRIEGSVEQLAPSIHVPRPLSDKFQAQKQPGEYKASPPYTVHLRYGALLEPWVTAVDFGY